MCHEVPALAEHGLSFGEMKIDRTKILDFKSDVINKLTSGLGQLAPARKVVSSTALQNLPLRIHWLSLQMMVKRSYF